MVSMVQIMEQYPQFGLRCLCFSCKLCFEVWRLVLACFLLTLVILWYSPVSQFCVANISFPEQGRFPDEDKEENTNNDEEGGDDGDKGELGLESMDGEEVEEEDVVGDHPGHLDVEEAGLLLHPGLLQRAAQDEQVGPGKEDADQERIFFSRGGLVLVQVFPNAGKPE